LKVIVSVIFQDVYVTIMELVCACKYVCKHE